MKMNQLSVTAVKAKVEPGYYGDGAGLYLQVSKAGTKSWLFKYTLVGKTREMGLGPLHAISLAEARDKAAHCRKLLVEKVDPIVARDAAQRAAQLEAARSMTFDQCAEAYIQANRDGWKNAKHVAQWTSTLAVYASPHFGSLPVQSIDTALVMKALQPIWKTKNETASRVRGRIASVLDWATVSEYRQGDNPARWTGHLEHKLPAPSKVKKVEHHPALPFAEIQSFTRALRGQAGVAARALEFAILTAARTNEVLGARWQEIDVDAALWIIPADRMKAGKEHRIPMIARALALIGEQGDADDQAFVFPGMRMGSALSNMAMLAVLKRMERTDVVPHGFRSTFRDWAGSSTSHPREVIEHALAHQLKDKAEAAYARGDLLAKRRVLMNDWSNYCETAPEMT